MKRTIIAAAILAVALPAIPASADTIFFDYPSLPGPASNCVWFDDNINDRSIDAIIKQTDLLYNRKALVAGENVTIHDRGTTQAGAQELSFVLDRRLLCAQADAFTAETAPNP